MAMTEHAAAGGGAAVMRLPIEFQGRARDYFGIWIVNVLLTAITLGIYSAWAKVRRLQFFFGNTRIAGDGFSYVARPIAILKGRLIVVAVIAAFVLAQQLLPLEFQGFLSLIFLPIYPWVINRSLRFNARVTVWRNIRFDWVGTYGEACKVLFLWPLAALLSLGIAFPFAARALREFIANNHRFGNARLSAATPIGPYYTAFGLSVLTFLAIVAATALPALPLLDLSVFESETDAMAAVDALSLVPFGILLSGFLAGTIFFARTRNIVMRALALEGGHRFDCNLSSLRLFWIRVSNMLAIALSLGLLWPWASVRAWRYLAEAMSVLPAGPLDDFVAGQAVPGSAVGSEFADIEGIDISL